MDEYDVNGYTDEQLFQILDLENPSDRILEAKILSMVRKYANFGNESGNKLSQFFIDIYNRFFENIDDVEEEIEREKEKEGFETYKVNDSMVGNGNVYNSGVIDTPLSGNFTAENINDLSKTGNSAIGPPVNFTKQLDYSKDNLNPLLKQTIKRIISIDSQYRNQQSNSPSTNFTFNLSEPLRDVVSLSLYSVQIPYTWYTVNSDFGGNFFYLKGTAPGINTGLYDYKFEIPSGNYTPSALIDALNISIKNVAAKHTDVSFGTTKALYNNGTGDSANGTGRCSLYIDIKNVYNESNYSLFFPTWSNPKIILTENGQLAANDEKLKTIPGYLGFNNKEYYCSSIYSNPFFLTVLKDLQNTQIKTKNTSFKIVPYVGSDYLNASTKFTAIDVSLNLNGLYPITISTMVTLMNSTLLSNNNFDSEFTKCTIIDISQDLYDMSYSYVSLQCKLNPFYAPVVRNLKLAAVFPYESNLSDSIFYGSNSFYGFSNAVMDNSSNVICEFNELLSEHRILESSYDISNTFLSFICTASGYDNSFNNIITTNIQNTTYTLNNLITSINNSITNAIIINHNANSNFNASISFNSESATSLLSFNTLIDNTYVNSDYYIYAETGGAAKLPSIFDLSTILHTDLPSNISSQFNNTNYQFNQVTFDASDIIYLVPISPGNKGAEKFKISFNTSNVYSNASQLATYLNSVITGYQDPNTQLYPLGGSSVTYSFDKGFSLTLNISLHMNQAFYRLYLYSGSSIWSKLSFNNASYNLKDYTNNRVESVAPIRTNTINITKDVNDTFSFVPSNSLTVFSSSADKYKIDVIIPANEYAINELLLEINNQLSQTIANGTKFYLELLSNGQTIIKIRFNINQVFTTKDYKLVFYDPYSFTTCFSNNSHNTTKSIQNATWDTTLGWLFGYRNKISYTLSDYEDIRYPDKSNYTLIYYLSDYVLDSSVCVLIGDTNVSTNLYNYFLIMLDDYVQNHLNDGLVTITNQETVLNTGPYVYVCDPANGQKIAIPAEYGTPGMNYTSQQLYAFNQQVQSQIIKQKSYSNGPFVQDIFGIIPVKTSGMSIGSVYVEFGGSLQNQQRLYFGPVNIHRMTIKLLNDRGNLVDLNNANWSFSFICEQLYKSSVS